MLLSHGLLMSLYALLVSLFFAVLWKRERKRQVKLFLQLFIGMVGGALLLAWLMYPFPSGPPTPFP
jgi:cytochrome bd-type quinol oxidase subunit 2